jgi:hypothetical protein
MNVIRLRPPHVWRIWRRLPRQRGHGNRHIYLANGVIIVPGGDGYNVFKIEHVKHARSLGQAKLFAGQVR